MALHCSPNLLLARQVVWFKGPRKRADSKMSNSCPVLVPLASVAVFWLPPESRKLLKRLRSGIFKSYRPDFSF
jgi:hypothetical protein